MEGQVEKRASPQVPTRNTAVVATNRHQPQPRLVIVGPLRGLAAATIALAGHRHTSQGREGRVQAKERGGCPLVPLGAPATTIAATATNHTPSGLGRADPTAWGLDPATRAPNPTTWALGRQSSPLSSLSPRARNTQRRREEPRCHPLHQLGHRTTLLQLTHASPLPRVPLYAREGGPHRRHLG